MTEISPHPGIYHNVPEWRMFYEFCGRDLCFLARKEGVAK